MCFILFGFAPVRAWERPINTYLVELTDVNRSPAIQGFADVFKNGADEPLHTRKAKPWITPPDLEQIALSASEAFQSARALLAKQDPAAAAFQLGQAAFYLQAISDPTRGLTTLQYSTYVEQIHDFQNLM